MSALLEHMDEIMLALRPREEFRPIPKAADREAWQAIRQKTGEECVKRAQGYVGFAWPVITATDIMLAAANGDARAFAPKYEYRRAALAALALGEAIEGKGRFLTDIINICFMICEESAWTLPENLCRPDGRPECLPNIERPNLDLGAARTGALLAATLYMHREKFREASPLIAIRIEREITLRVIDPFINGKGAAFTRVPGEIDPLPEGIKDCLTALLFTERDDRYRWRGVKKALQLLDGYIEGLPHDGGVPGGMGAFEASAGCLMEALELISEAAGGGASFFTILTLRRLGDFVIGNHIDLDYFNCSGNCPAHLDADANLIYRCGGLIRSEPLKSLGAYLMRLKDVSALKALPMLRMARAVLDENDMLRHDSRAPMPMDYYLRSRELLCVRSRTGASDGFFASFEGGANTPGSHADAGNIAVFFGGAPVLPDLGEIEYARAMTPSERAALWETQSQYHNLPVVNNCAQAMGEGFAAEEPIWELTPERSRATLDIARAYPKEAGLLSWQRTLSILRDEQPCVRLWEIVEFEKDSNDIEFNFITTCRPYIKPHAVELNNMVLAWDAQDALSCEVEDLPPRQAREYDPEGLYDKWLLSLCGKPLFRMALTLHGAPRKFNICFTLSEKTDA